MAKLKTITTPGGHRFTVNAEHADRFLGLLTDLEASGYAIKGNQSGGYNYRTIAGTNKLSEHAHGNAVDINWHDNARGTKGNIDPELARRLATQHGMTWGGDWRNPDPMHFEIAHGQPGHKHIPGDETVVASAPAQSQAETRNMFDMDTLSKLLYAGGGQKQEGGGSSSADLAKAGMASLTPAQMPQINMQAQRPQVDMSRLAQVLANRSKLGV